MLLSQQRLRQILGALWLIDGLLQLQQMFTPYMVYGVIMPALQDQPAPVVASMQWMVGVTQPNLLLLNLLVAGVELVIGLSLLLRRWVRVSLIASVMWALIAWCSVEGLGLLLTGRASLLTGAPGAFLLYALLGLAAYPQHSSQRAFGDIDERGLFTRVQVRWCLAGLWCLGGLLQLQPPWWVLGEISGSIGVMQDGGGLNDILVDPILRALSDSTASASIEIPLNVVLVALFLGLGIAIAAVKERWLRPMLVASIAVSLVIWWGCEALGNILTGMTTDVNTGPLFVLMALACWPRWPSPSAVRDRSAGTVQQRADVELAPSAERAGLNGNNTSPPLP
jgi:hypothetical protein